MSNEVQPVNNSSSKIYNNKSQNINSNKKAENDSVKKIKQNRTQNSRLKDQVKLSNSEDNSSNQSKKNISKINKFAQLVNTRLKFSVDRESEETVIYVIDKKSDKVIRSIPPQQLSRLAGKLEDIKDTMV